MITVQNNAVALRYCIRMIRLCYLHVNQVYLSQRLRQVTETENETIEYYYTRAADINH